MIMPVGTSGITLATADPLYYNALVSPLGKRSAGTGLVIYLDGVA